MYVSGKLVAQRSTQVEDASNSAVIAGTHPDPTAWARTWIAHQVELYIVMCAAARMLHSMQSSKQSA